MAPLGHLRTAPVKVALFVSYRFVHLAVSLKCLDEVYANNNVI